MKPVNLNKVRKARARQEAKASAESNAVKFGRSKADKIRDASETSKTARLLDGAKRDP